MALYLGSSKEKIKLRNTTFNLNIYVPSKSTSARLKSSDNYILKDKNSLYLIPKGGE